MIDHKHQMSRHDRTWGTSKVGGCDGRVEAPAADYAQGGRHVPSVGIASSFSRSGVSHCLTCLPVNWRGLRAPSFSLRFAGGLQTRHRRLALPLLPERGADKFSRRLTKSRAHQLRTANKPGSDRADPFHGHSQSSWFQRQQTYERPNPKCWNSVPRMSDPR